MSAFHGTFLRHNGPLEPMTEMDALRSFNRGDGWSAEKRGTLHPCSIKQCADGDFLILRYAFTTCAVSVVIRRGKDSLKAWVRT